MSYSWPSSLSCGVSDAKMHADRCCEISRKSGITSPFFTSDSLSRVLDRFVFFAMPSRSVTQLRSVSPPLIAESWSALRSSGMSIPAIFVTRSRSTTSWSDCPAFSALAMYCSSPSSSIVGYFL